mmetsp:Transcript_22289/g.32577  ORF Transcript_22289/g.32577 Transcript_22289/m.32577 type:complete len:221 (-) Transcript_22289:411-1073(-)
MTVVIVRYRILRGGVGKSIHHLSHGHFHRSLKYLRWRHVRIVRIGTVHIPPVMRVIIGVVFVSITHAHADLHARVKELSLLYSMLLLTGRKWVGVHVVVIPRTVTRWGLSWRLRGPSMKRVAHVWVIVVVAVVIISAISGWVVFTHHGKHHGKDVTGLRGGNRSHDAGITAFVYRSGEENVESLRSFWIVGTRCIVVGVHVLRLLLVLRVDSWWEHVWEG